MSTQFEHGTIHGRPYWLRGARSQDAPLIAIGDAECNLVDFADWHEALRVARAYIEDGTYESVEILRTVGFMHKAGI